MDTHTTIEQLRRAGYRITTARRSVISVLNEMAGHVTAPEVVEAVQHRAPGVGRASVYRTLDLLVTLGLVQASSLGGTTTSYILTPAGHHHHIVCTDCHTTIEFENCVLDDFDQRLADEVGFQLKGHLLEIYGRCPDCEPASAT